MTLPNKIRPAAIHVIAYCGVRGVAFVSIRLRSTRIERGPNTEAIFLCTCCSRCLGRCSGSSSETLSDNLACTKRVPCGRGVVGRDLFICNCLRRFLVCRVIPTFSMTLPSKVIVRDRDTLPTLQDVVSMGLLYGLAMGSLSSRSAWRDIHYRKLSPLV